MCVWCFQSSIASEISFILYFPAVVSYSCLDLSLWLFLDSELELEVDDLSATQ